MNKLPPVVILSGAVLAIAILAAAVGPALSPYAITEQSLLKRLQPPVFAGGTWEFPLGTDQLGRDMLTRVVYGLRSAIIFAAAGTTISVVLGVTMGLISGYAGRRTDSFIMFLVDAQSSLPITILAMAATATFGPDPIVLVLVIGFAGWEGYARVVRGQVLGLKEAPYVEAAWALAAPANRIVFRHLLPGVLAPVTAMATLGFSGIIVLESGLSFLGLGIQPPIPSLGNMLSLGRDYLATAWWMAIVPAVALALLAACVSTLGDWLRDRLDPEYAR